MNRKSIVFFCGAIPCSRHNTFLDRIADPIYFFHVSKVARYVLCSAAAALICFSRLKQNLRVGIIFSRDIRAQNAFPIGLRKNYLNKEKIIRKNPL